MRWTAEGFNGRKSGFIVFVASSRLAHALPNEIVLEFAKGLTELYLLNEIEPDRIYVEDLFLEVPRVDPPPAAWRWSAGVNYFCAQGDGRWWQDHRVPGGMALSVNSVGHMAKSGVLIRALETMGLDLDVSDGAVSKQPIDSLHKALEIAMMTIDRAAETESGTATRLLDRPEDPREMAVPECPVKLPASLEGKNHCEYVGYYHTDITLPRAYFVPDALRPIGTAVQSLDFTYLFDDSLDNPDYIRMGKGQRIRESEAIIRDRLTKRRRSLLETVPIAQYPRLVAALKSFN